MQCLHPLHSWLSTLYSPPFHIVSADFAPFFVRLRHSLKLFSLHCYCSASIFTTTVATHMICLRLQVQPTLLENPSGVNTTPPRRSLPVIPMLHLWRDKDNRVYMLSGQSLQPQVRADWSWHILRGIIATRPSGIREGSIFCHSKILNDVPRNYTHSQKEKNRQREENLSFI